MKTLKQGLLVVLAAASFMACKKNDSPVNATLEASKTSSIKKNEPVIFTLSPASADTVVWSVNPSANTQINSSGNQASVLFGARGNYTVTAVSRNITTSRTVSVTDTVYNPGGGGSTPPAILPFSAGELIKITASKIDTGSTYHLIFSAQTTNSYSCFSNSLITETINNTGGFTLNYTGVSVPEGCTTGSEKAGAFSYLYPVQPGTSTLTINFNGTVYTGTVVRSGNNLTINWNYTAGVIISPTTL